MSAKGKQLYQVRFEPSGLKVEVPAGTNLLEAARLAGVYLTSICGGDGYCGKCKIIVDQGEFRSKSTTLLTQSELREDTVLACQTEALSDPTVTVPKSHGLETGQI
ncbi:MAG: 2Fe-2S iron-sulfur cluster-binding protein, partial [Planctomycetia bacterium]|nr:2Fe-2S iron-sulfur cluster-binding protein [Planctomycetia bacterium]